MDVPTILSYVRAVVVDWGLMPYIQAGLLLLVTVGAIAAVTAWLNNR